MQNKYKKVNIFIISIVTLLSFLFIGSASINAADTPIREVTDQQYLNNVINLKKLILNRPLKRLIVTKPFICTLAQKIVHIVAHSPLY